MKLLFAIWLTALSCAAQGVSRAPTLTLDVDTPAHVRAWLNLGVPTPPSARDALGRAMGCPASRSTAGRDFTGIPVDCSPPWRKPAFLQWSEQWDFTGLAAELRSLGILTLTVDVFHPRTGFSQLLPAAIAKQPGSGFGVSYRGVVPVASLGTITLQAGVEKRRIRLACAAAGVILFFPFLLFFFRSAGPAMTLAAGHGLFCLAATIWLCASLPVAVGAAVVEPWLLVTVPVPLLLAVWIGSRISGGSRSRILFWRGVLATACLMMLAGAFAAGPVLVAWSSACVAAIVTAGLQIRRGTTHRLEPLNEGELLARARDVAARAGVSLRGVKILSGGEDSPAAFAARTRDIVLSRSLVSGFARREVDAVMAHELSHLRRPNRASARLGGFLVVGAVLTTVLVPATLPWIPLLLPPAFLAHRAIRRRNEFVADADGAAWSADPEAFITGLARVTLAHRMPMEWPLWSRALMPHPSTLDRVRVLARRAGLGDERLQELIAAASVPAADSYSIPAAAASAFTAAERKRLNVRLTLVSLAIPVAFGVAAPFIGYFVAFAAGAIAACLLPEWVLHQSRSRARAALSSRSGIFTGFSPSVEPRIYEGSFDYDWGFAAFENGCLVFRGDRCSWSIPRSGIERIWSSPGPFNWMPRPVLCVGLKSGPAFTLRPFDGAFGPAAPRAAARFLRQVSDWLAANDGAAGASNYDFGFVHGEPPQQYTWQTLIGAFPRYGAIAVAIEWFLQYAVAKTGLPDMQALLGSAAVAFALATFMAYPAIRRAKSPEPQPSLLTPNS